MLWAPLITLAVILVINYIVGKKFEEIAVDKGYSVDQTHPFAMCFWLGIIGMIYVLALPNKKAIKVQEDILAELKKQPVKTVTSAPSVTAAPVTVSVPGKVKPVPVAEENEELPDL